MASLIEELYHGNIDPQERGYHQNSRVMRISSSLNILEEKLTERLQGEEKKMFLDFLNHYAELIRTSDLDAFIVGFRLGAQFTYDTFVNGEAPFLDFGKGHNC